MMQAHRGPHLPPAEPERITLGDLVGLVGVLIFIVGMVLWAAVVW